MKINEKEYKLKLTGYTLVVYKEQFHKDMFSAIAELEKGIDVVSLMEIIWAFAKSSDKSIPDFEEFTSSITDLSSLLSKENFSELTSIIKSSSQRTIEPKKV